MARYDSHVKRLEKRLRQQEFKKISGNIQKALQLNAETGELPSHLGLRNFILRIKETTRQMAETLPGMTKPKKREGETTRLRPEISFPGITKE
jgi:hypothetical protein